MKRFLLLFMAAFLITLSPAFAIDGSLGTGELTASSLVYSGVCWITGVQVVTDGVNDAKIIVYDATEASGKVITEITVTGAYHYGGQVWTFPEVCRNGIYVAVTGTGASYFIRYRT